MKKHSALTRASGILLVLTLVTSCFVGGTFAKYVTDGEGTDTARVAKWGVKVEVTGDGFKTSYGKDDPEASSEAGSNSVVSAGEETVRFTWMSGGQPESADKKIENVLAPGTDGTFGGVSITGRPEVAVEIVTTADVKLTGWNVGDNGEFYCPLVFTIGEETINGLDYTQKTSGGKDSFENAIKTAIQNATSKTLPANTDLSTVGEDITYSWEWPFEDGKGTSGSQSDELDTVLGDNAASGDPEKIPGIWIDVTTTVTQVD